MRLKSALNTMRRRASALVELPWHCGFFAMGKLLRSSVRHWSSMGAERVLAVAPHPDDEAIACSGTILRHVLCGDKVVVVVATDGRLAGAAPTPDQVAALRKDEATQAAGRLGVARLEWLGLREGAWHVDDLQERLIEVLQRVAPTIVYAPSRVDFHPEHLAVAHAFGRALDSMGAGRGTCIRVYQVQVPLTRILTNLVADVSEVVGQSATALRAYQSQYGSIESVYRRRRYGALAHSVRGPVEEFWELTADQYAALHRGSMSEWGGKFRGMRRFSWTDPLAYVLGATERRRLRSSAEQGSQPRAARHQGAVGAAG
jgi:LmbE family N-acetylglucosaminyl deacetylase